MHLSLFVQLRFEQGDALREIVIEKIAEAFLERGQVFIAQPIVKLHKVGTVFGFRVGGSSSRRDNRVENSSSVESSPPALN